MAASAPLPLTREHANSTCTFAHAQDLVTRFERVLLGIEIKIQPGAVLERLCLNSIDLCEKHEHPKLMPADSGDCEAKRT